MDKHTVTLTGLNTRDVVVSRSFVRTSMVVVWADNKEHVYTQAARWGNSPKESYVVIADKDLGDNFTVFGVVGGDVILNDARIF